MKINRRNSARDKDKLTDKENRFVIEYLRDYNGLQAATRAGYSEATAGQIAYELLRRPRVRNKIDEHEKDLSTRFLVTRERLMKEMSIAGYADMADYVDVENGEVNIKDFKDLPPQITRAIKKVECNKTVKYLRDNKGKRTGEEVEHITTKLELHDGLKAKELMGKEVGMFKDKVELSGPGGKDLVPTNIVIEFTGKQ
jgi:phage terminase small subunit